jgi:eukaryotic-like serine/threonine-protein kinase
VVGEKLGPYEIVAKLGAGGMGEVYRARDTRLDRTVAIKVLSPQTSGDAEFRQRFEREGRSISTLDHPNICALYDVGEERGISYLVMQYLEGETLAARLARAGPSAPTPAGPAASERPPSDGASPSSSRRSRRLLPIDEVLRLAREVALALSAAHHRGVIHRDLKPGNVMVTKTGAKLLDFGLAKIGRRSDAAAVDDVTRLAHLGPRDRFLTARGTFLGTLPYMAPEQLEGGDADARTDIFAFGAMLFEMMTGRRPFDGHSEASIIAAILSVERPSFSAEDVRPDLAPVTRRDLSRLVRKCLEKHPDDRWQCAADLAAELTAIARDPSGVADEASSGARSALPTITARSRLVERAWMAAAVVGIAAAGTFATLWWSRPTGSAIPTVRFVMPPPSPTDPFKAGPGLMNLSPDGRRLAFIAGTDGALWIRALDAAEPRRLNGTEGAWQPAWSPDGRSIVYMEGGDGSGRLKRVGLDGAQPITLSDRADGPAAWSPSGVLLVGGPNRHLYRMSDNGGAMTAVTELDRARRERAHHWPVFLPDGRRFIFLARSEDVGKSALFLASIDSPGRTHLVDANSSVAIAPGYLFYHREGTLMAHRFDERAGRVVGDAFPVIENITYNPSNGRAAFSVAADGTLAYRATGTYGSDRITELDASGVVGRTVGERGEYNNLALSPDGRRLAMRTRDESGQGDIVVLDLERDVQTRLTTDPGDDATPAWSPDGAFVYYRATRNGQPAVYRRATGGGPPEERVFQFRGTPTLAGLTFDRKALLLHVCADLNVCDIWTLPFDPAAAPAVLFSTPAYDGYPTQSPDGRWLAYESEESSDGSQIYVQELPAGERIRLSTTRGFSPRWTTDGKRVIYANSSYQMMAVDVSDPRRPGTPVRLFTQPSTAGNARTYAMDSDGRRFFFAVSQTPAADVPIAVIVNWVAGLGQRPPN